MAQASFWRKQLNTMLSPSSRRYKTRPLRSVNRSGLGSLLLLLLGLVLVFTMLLWHWQLLLATITGIGVMTLLYFAQEWDWQHKWRSWQRFLKGFNRQLLVAVGGGGFAATGIYLATAIWSDSESPGIAIATILQGCVTFLTLTLVLFQVGNRPERSEGNLEQQLQSLTHNEPLQRLMAVRQLTRWASRRGLSSTHRQQIVEYFRLMLTQEKETIIQDALWESLQTIDKIQLIPQPRPSQPLQVPHLQSYRKSSKVESIKEQI